MLHQQFARQVCLTVSSFSLSFFLPNWSNPFGLSFSPPELLRYFFILFCKFVWPLFLSLSFKFFLLLFSFTVLSLKRTTQKCTKVCVDRDYNYNVTDMRNTARITGIHTHTQTQGDNSNKAHSASSGLCVLWPLVPWPLFSPCIYYLFITIISHSISCFCFL